MSVPRLHPEPADLAQIRENFRVLTQLIEAGALGAPATLAVADQTIGATGSLFVADCTAGAVTLTLPRASDGPTRTIVGKKLDASGNALILAAATGDTVEGAANLSTTTQYDGWQLQNDGDAAWFITGKVG